LNASKGTILGLPGTLASMVNWNYSDLYVKPIKWEGCMP